MTPAEIRADYSNTMNRVGEPVVIRQFVGVGDSRTSAEFSTRARILGFNPHEIIGSVEQDDNQVIILAEDLATAGMTGEIRRGDRLIARSREYNIESADYNTIRVQGVLIATKLRIRG